MAQCEQGCCQPGVCASKLNVRCSVLQQYIKKIRAASTQEERENIVFKELAKIRQKYSSQKKVSGASLRACFRRSQPEAPQLALSFGEVYVSFTCEVVSCAWRGAPSARRGLLIIPAGKRLRRAERATGARRLSQTPLT